MSTSDIAFYVSLGMIALGLSPFVFAGVAYLIEHRLSPALRVLREHRAETCAAVSADLVGDVLFDEPQSSGETGAVAVLGEDAVLFEGFVRVDGAEDAIQSGSHPQRPV